jgi:hypothetical protein
MYACKQTSTPSPPEYLLVFALRSALTCLSLSILSLEMSGEVPVYFSSPELFVDLCSVVFPVAVLCMWNIQGWLRTRQS